MIGCCRVGCYRVGCCRVGCYRSDAIGSRMVWGRALSDATVGCVPVGLMLCVYRERRSTVFRENNELPAIFILPPLVYQTTTPLGLAQVQLRSPKVVVATGAAVRALKNGITFLSKIKSSSPIKYEYVNSLSHRLRVQSIKFGVGQMNVRTGTYEHLCLLR